MQANDNNLVFIKRIYLCEIFGKETLINTTHEYDDGNTNDNNNKNKNLNG